MNYTINLGLLKKKANVHCSLTSYFAWKVEKTWKSVKTLN